MNSAFVECAVDQEQTVVAGFLFFAIITILFTIPNKCSLKFYFLCEIYTENA